MTFDRSHALDKINARRVEGAYHKARQAGGQRCDALPVLAGNAIAMSDFRDSVDQILRMCIQY